MLLVWLPAVRLILPGPQAPGPPPPGRQGLQGFEIQAENRAGAVTDNAPVKLIDRFVGLVEQTLDASLNTLAGHCPSLHTDESDTAIVNAERQESRWTFRTARSGK
jgi:hypothetical protein